MSHQRLLSMIAGGLLSVSLAHAQPNASGSATAAEHFRRGLAYAKDAELALAASEFEAAYAKSPHHSVLYNLAQAYTALGRPVEAITTFERYLSEGGASIDQARREQVQSLITLNRERTGRLLLRVVEPGTRVWLDGKELGPAQLDKPIALGSGQHTLLFTTAAGAPASRVLSITAGRETTLELRAEPSSPALLSGQLALECDVPQVQVSVDGWPHGTPPLPSALLATAGPHRVSFERAGYAPASSSVVVRPNALVSVTCAMQPLAVLSPKHRAWLKLDVTPLDARVSVDGRHFVGGALPYGTHAVLIERSGYLPHRRTVTIPIGQTLTLSARLALSPAERKLRDQASARRTTGWVLGGVGGAFIATGVGLLLYNAGEYDDWQARKGSVSDGENLRSATTIQRVDDLSIGLLLTGAGLLGTGTWLAWPAKSN